MSARIDWSNVTAEAVAIAESYSFAPTLRQVYYRLVAAGLIPNRLSSYKRLSELTAEMRRSGTCPAFADGTRSIEVAPSWSSPAAILEGAARQYRLDRTLGQEVQAVVVLEKATLTQLARQVADPLSVPVVALRGYGSQTIVDDLAARLDADGRPASLVYVGDYDPTGLDIERDLISRLTVEVEVERLAVTAEQVDDLGLVPAPAKATDPRTAAMLVAEGQAVQVEAEAIDPQLLQDFIADALAARTDEAVLDSVLDAEAADRAILERIFEDLS